MWAVLLQLKDKNQNLKEEEETLFPQHKAQISLKSKIMLLGSRIQELEEY